MTSNNTNVSSNVSIITLPKVATNTKISFPPPPLSTPLSSSMLVNPHCPHHHKKVSSLLVIVF